MSKVKCLEGVFVWVIFLFLPPIGAEAKVINVDVEYSSDTTYSGTAAAPDSGTYWNRVTDSGENLLDSFGTPTTVDVSHTRYSYWRDGVGVVDALLADYAYSYFSVETITIGGLTPDKPYDLYLYANQSVGGGGATFIFDGVNKTASGVQNAGNPYVEGQSYVVYRGIQADGSGEISGTYGVVGEIYNRFNGLQLVPTPSVSIDETDGSTSVWEHGPTSDTYTIVLGTEPTDTVTITVDPDVQTDVGNGPSEPNDFIFTTGNWYIAQTVTVTAVDDTVPEGPHTSTIAHTAVSTDSDYNGISIDDVIANLMDNDVPGVTIVETDGDTKVRETGLTSDMYTIALDGAPTDTVTITVDPNIQTDVGNGPGVSKDLIFTIGNWDIEQIVTVAAVADGVVEGLHSSTITHSAASNDSGYNGIGIDDVVVSVYEYLWDFEPSLWDAAQTVTLTQNIGANWPPYGPMWKAPPGEQSASVYQGVYLSNYPMRIGLWGPAEQLTLSIRKNDIWDRRTPLTSTPFPTIDDMWAGAFNPANAESGFLIHGRSGYMSPTGGSRISSNSWSQYPFPIQKDTGQAILFLPDFAASGSQDANINCDDGTVRVHMVEGGAEAELTYLTMMTRNVMAIQVNGTGLSSQAKVRVYRHNDTIGALPPYSAIDPPVADQSGRFFWIRQTMPSERTFPSGFEYVLMGMISSQTPTLSTANNQQYLGTPGGAVPSNVYGSAATATLPLDPSIAFTAYITVVTSNDSGDILNEAQQRLLAAEADGMAALIAENATWYQDFYNQRENGRVFDGTPGRVAKKIPEIFRSWVFAHGRTSHPDPTKYECDSWNSELFDNDGGAWHGIPCYNELYFNQFHVMNRSDQVDYYPKLVKMWLDASIQNATDVFSLPGMFGPAHGYVPPIDPNGPYPHNIFTWEFCMEIPAQIMKIGWDTFDYGGDETYLADVVYPALRELAIFYAAYVTEEDGDYNVIPTVGAEHWGWTYQFVRNRNSAAALSMFKWTLSRAADASEILGVDASLRAGWRQIANNMAPYSTWPTAEGPVFTDMEGVNPLTVALDDNYGYNFFDGVVPTVLADDINLDSDPCQIEIMLRTPELVGGGDMHQSGWMNPAVYHLLGADKDIMHHHWPAWSWWVMQGPISLTDQDNLMMATLLEPDRLINSRSGKIHLFPCVPDGATLAFKRMQARGGFLVSAELADGEIAYVLIESRRNVNCRIWNPWPDWTVVLTRNGVPSEELTGLQLDFVTEPGESIELTKGYRRVDFNKDRKINFEDFATFAGHWHQSGCAGTETCGGADFDENTVVNMADLKLLVEGWLSY